MFVYNIDISIITIIIIIVMVIIITILYDFLFFIFYVPRPPAILRRPVDLILAPYVLYALNT